MSAFKFRPDRDMDRNGNTNAVRADRAQAAVTEYATGNYRDLDDPCVIQDILCDLMHLCDRRGCSDDEGGDFSTLLEQARGCYEEER